MIFKFIANDRNFERYEYQDMANFYSAQVGAPSQIKFDTIKLTPSSVSLFILGKKVFEAPLSKDKVDYLVSLGHDGFLSGRLEECYFSFRDEKDGTVTPLRLLISKTPRKNFEKIPVIWTGKNNFYIAESRYMESGIGIMILLSKFKDTPEYV